MKFRHHDVDAVLITVPRRGKRMCANRSQILNENNESRRSRRGEFSHGTVQCGVLGNPDPVCLPG